MKQLTDDIKASMTRIFDNIDKTTKTAEKLVRKETLALAKLGKQYRADSVAQYK